MSPFFVVEHAALGDFDLSLFQKPPLCVDQVDMIVGHGFVVMERCAAFNAIGLMELIGKSLQQIFRRISCQLPGKCDDEFSGLNALAFAAASSKAVLVFSGEQIPEGRGLRVRRSMYYDSENKAWELKVPKSGKERIVDFGATLAGILEEARHTQRKNEAEYGPMYQKHYYQIREIAGRQHYIVLSDIPTDSGIISSRDEMTMALKILRGDLKTADKIRERTKHIRENAAIEERMRQRNGKVISKVER